MIVAIFAGLSLVYSAVTHFAVKNRKNYILLAFVGYMLLFATIVILLSSTQYESSPFVTLWILLALFAPIFGLFGPAIVLLSAGGYIALLASRGLLDMGVVITISVLTLIPLAIGYVIWRSKAKIFEEQTNGDLSYHELANELSAVSGQSEVVIAAIADGVIALNTKGQVQLINPAAQRLIGWGKSDALGLHYKSVIKLLDNHDQAVNDTNDPIQQAISSNKEKTVDNFYITTQDAAKKILVSMTVSPVGAMGSGVIIVFRDITKERAEEKEQTEFISTASHEMRTPVASIEGYLGLALNPSTAQIDERAREYIDKAQASAKHLGRLFQDLLDVSKADDGRLANNPEIIDVVAFTYDIIQGLERNASDKGLYISFPPMPNLSNEAQPQSGKNVSPVYYANIDNTHLREIIGNLIENAIKYTPQGGVTVDIEADNESITISIKDSGIGIPKEDIPHLFQKFYRVDNSDTREIGGTGLGLYLSRKLIEVMGGRIWVESTYKQGSTFFVRIARMDAVEARKLIEESAESKEAKDLPAQNQSNFAADINKPVGTVPVAPLPNIIVPPNDSSTTTQTQPTPVNNYANQSISPSPSTNIHSPTAPQRLQVPNRPRLTPADRQKP